jgi:hypothetical protein
MITVRPRPCPSCPYRRDVPPGIWDDSEYDKLPGYDHDVPEQAMAGASGLFGCHTHPDQLCSGWVGCHDMENNLAIRLHWRNVDPAVFDYVSPVPLFGSGAEAAAHGKQEPDLESDRKMRQIIRIRKRRR